MTLLKFILGLLIFFTIIGFIAKHFLDERIIGTFHGYNRNVNVLMIKTVKGDIRSIKVKGRKIERKLENELKHAKLVQVIDKPDLTDIRIV